MVESPANNTIHPPCEDVTVINADCLLSVVGAGICKYVSVSPFQNGNRKILEPVLFSNCVN